MGAFKQRVIKLLGDSQKLHAQAMLNNVPVGVNLGHPYQVANS